MRCGRRATATSDRTARDPGQRSVRLRCLDVRQELGTQPPKRCCSAPTCRGRAGSRVPDRPCQKLLITWPPACLLGGRFVGSMSRGHGPRLRSRQVPATVVEAGHSSGHRRARPAPHGSGLGVFR
ncbi:DUF6207 family protein [Streptomyces sp. enrichment culture]|uniref:DUF6207 family protein n=1 Tax=Streptomyces sp. enrichment culture TaxID=1795815 RepID=UPI003F5442E3